MHAHITVHTAPSEKAEAEFVVHTIERMIGGHSFFSIDSGRAPEGPQTELSFSDIAVLYRSRAQAPALYEALAREADAQRHAVGAPLVGVDRVDGALDVIHHNPFGPGLRAREEHDELVPSETRHRIRFPGDLQRKGSQDRHGRFSPAAASIDRGQGGF